MPIAPVVPIPLVANAWSLNNIAPGVIVGGRVGGMAMNEPPGRIYRSDFKRCHHTVHRDLVAPTVEFEGLASFLMQVSQHPNQRAGDFELMTMSSSTADTPHTVHLPRFTFVFKDYAGRRVTVRPLFVPGMPRDTAHVKGYTFLTERCFFKKNAAAHRTSLRALLSDVKHNARDTNVPMQNHFDQYSWFEHFRTFLGKSIVVAATGSAVLVGLVMATTVGLAAKVAVAVGLKAAVGVLVVACAASGLFPVVAIIAGIALLVWCRPRD